MRGVAGRFSQYQPGGRRLSPQIQALRRTFNGRVAAPENEAVRDKERYSGFNCPSCAAYPHKNTIFGDNV